MNQFEAVIKYSKQIEGVLERGFGAEGKGLHEKLSSVEDRFDEGLVRQIRRIATIRNKVVHEDGYLMEDPRSFEDDCDEVLDTLKVRAGLSSAVQPRAGDKAAPVRAPQIRSGSKPAPPLPERKLTQTKFNESRRLSVPVVDIATRAFLIVFALLGLVGGYFTEGVGGALVGCAGGILLVFVVKWLLIVASRFVVGLTMFLFTHKVLLLLVVLGIAGYVFWGLKPEWVMRLRP